MADTDLVAMEHDVLGTAEWIRELGLRKVALQLPVRRRCALRAARGAGVDCNTHRRSSLDTVWVLDAGSFLVSSACCCSGTPRSQ